MPPIKSTSKPPRSVRDVMDEAMRGRPELREAWERTRVARDLATALVQARTAAGLNQAQLARKAGWDKAFVSRLEDALSGTPDLATLARYLQACGAMASLAVARLDGGTARVESLVPLIETQALAVRQTPALPPGEDDAFARLVERELIAALTRLANAAEAASEAPVVQQDKPDKKDKKTAKKTFAPPATVAAGKM
ncbi:MAG: helix-turn-helix transcriptional regulator [Rhizomicrobium sp.]